MSYRNRALVALALAGALTVSGFALAAAKTSRKTTSTESSKKGDGYLGVNLQELSDGLADSYDYKGSGVVVTSVVPGSPADNVGVEEGDIITRFNGLAVNSVEQLTTRVRQMEPGSLADITVWRDGSIHELGRAEIGDVDDAPSYTPRAPRAPRAPQAPRVYGYKMDPDMMKGMHSMIAPGRGRLGVETRDLDADLGSYFGSTSGVLVLHVQDDTPASRAGLKAGDVILSVGGEKVSDTDELRRALRSKDEGNVDLRIRRKGAERTVTAKLEDKGDVGMWGNDDHDWMGWQGDDGMKVFRFRGPNGGGHAWMGNGDDFNMEGLSDEDKAQLKKDIDQLKQDLKEMRKERDKHDDNDD